MYLDDYCKNNDTAKTYKAGATTYAPAYRFWRNKLFKFVMKIFTWEGLDIPNKEIETRLIMSGKCGIIHSNKGKLTAVDVNLYGITEYMDEFTSFNYSTPFESGHRDIGVDGVLIDNDSLRDSAFYIIHHYAVMLAHTEVTFINVLINARDMKSYIASDDKTAKGIREYRNKLYMGNPDAIVDDSFLGIDTKDTNNNTLLSINDLMATRRDLLNSFFEDIGVKHSNDGKRERLITDEVNANNGLLRLNIRDEFECRIKACDEINRIFGTHATVICNVDIDDDGTTSDENGGAMADNGGAMADNGEEVRE